MTQSIRKKATVWQKATTIPAAAQKSLHGWSPSMMVVMQLLNRIKVGTLSVTFPDGTQQTFQGDPYVRDLDLQADITLHDAAVARSILSGGYLAFNEAYLDGHWSSTNIYALFRLVLANEAVLDDRVLTSKWARLASYIGHRLRPNSKRGSRKNIAAHYDLGNSFYQKWLDRSMTYSSAVYEPVELSLEEAQHMKYRRLAESAGIKRHHHVLEIGCGWGGMAEYVAREIGAKITAITISQEQYDFACKRIAEAGLEDRAEIKLVDYRDVQGQFDRIVSIEMFEAVGETYWPTFFQTLHDRLKPEGRAALQIITIDNQRFHHYRERPDYIQKYIFPGGMLPSIAALRLHTRKVGLTWKGAQHYGRDYARTLIEWDQRFQEAWPQIEVMDDAFDIRFKRMWEQYLHYCAAGFDAGTIDVIQCVMERG